MIQGEAAAKTYRLIEAYEDRDTANEVMTDYGATLVGLGLTERYGMTVKYLGPLGWGIYLVDRNPADAGRVQAP